MKHREFIGSAVSVVPLMHSLSPTMSRLQTSPNNKLSELIRRVFIYGNNWSAYDKLSDNVPLTERFANLNLFISINIFTNEIKDCVSRVIMWGMLWGVLGG